MPAKTSQGPEAVGKEDRAAPKLKTWETPRVIAADVYLTQAGGSLGSDASSLQS
jgi:hypothetical protein